MAAEANNKQGDNLIMNSLNWRYAMATTVMCSGLALAGEPAVQGQGGGPIRDIPLVMDRSRWWGIVKC